MIVNVPAAAGSRRRSFLPWVRSSPSLTFAFDALRCAVALMPATLLWGASFPLLMAAAARFAARFDAAGLADHRHQHRRRARRRAESHPDRHPDDGQPALATGARADGRRQRLSRSSSRAPRARCARRTWPSSPSRCSLAIWIVPPIPGRLIAYGRSVDSWNSIKRFLYLAEGATASVAVTEGIAGARQFHIAGKVEASDMDVDMRLERMLGHIPALVHPQPALGPHRRRRRRRHRRRAVDSSGGRANRDLRDRADGADERARSTSATRTTTSSTTRACELIFDDARHFLQTTDETLRHHHVGSDPSVGPRRRDAVLARIPATGTRASQSRRRGHAVDPAVRNRRARRRRARSPRSRRCFRTRRCGIPICWRKATTSWRSGRVEPAPISEARDRRRMQRERGGARVVEGGVVEIGGGGARARTRAAAAT